MNSHNYTNQHKATLLFAILAITLLYPHMSIAREFSHPSILLNNNQLNYLAHNNCSTRKDAFALMADSKFASLERPHHAFETVFVESYTVNKYEQSFRGDAHAARALALMWVITGDDRYLNKSKLIISEWSSTFRNIEVSKGGKDQAYLEAAWALPIWLGAADILRFYNNGVAEWNTVDQQKFQRFAEKLGDYASKGYKRSNWGASSVLSEMSLAVYLEDEKRFNKSLKKYKQNFSDISLPSGALTADYLRDTWHPQYTLSAWVQTAEIAWHNGIDLYSITYEKDTPRLLIVLDHFSTLFNGEISSPEGLKKGTYRNSHLNGSGYFQIAYNHYVTRTQHGRSKSFVKAYENWYPGKFTQFFMSWDGLTHYTCNANKVY